MSTETIPFTPPLHHDRGEFCDWGWVRDAAGVLIYTVKLPIFPNSPEADEHRRNKTDPTQARVDALLEAFAAKERLDSLIEQLQDAARLCELERMVSDQGGDVFYRGKADAFRQAADMARRLQIITGSTPAFPAGG